MKRSPGTPRADKRAEQYRKIQRKLAKVLSTARDIENVPPAAVSVLETAGKMMLDLLAEIEALEAVNKARKAGRK